LSDQYAAQVARRDETLRKLYIGNLAHDATEADLMERFSEFGKVVSTKVAADRRGRAKGFGHVEMADEESARAAMEGLRGKELRGRLMDVVLEDTRGRRGGPPRGRRR
jgi:RNA recognition motif-containing protein